MKGIKTDTINEVKKKLDSYFGQADGGCGEAGGLEEVPLFQANDRYLAEEIFAEDGPLEGQKIYDRGHRITVKDVGALATLGFAMVQVFIKPIVFIISNGDKIVSVFEEPGPGQVRDINSYTLATLIEKTGAKVGGISLVRGVEGELKKAVKEALDRSDMVLISGESSANQESIAEVLHSLGEPGVITQGIAMKPGQESVISIMKDEHCSCCSRSKLAIGLSGHPMEAIITYKVMVDYFIKKYYFKTDSKEVLVTAKVTKNISAEEGKDTFALVKLCKEGVDWRAEPVDEKIEAISQLQTADGFIKLSAQIKGIEQGEMVEVFPL